MPMGLAKRGFQAHSTDIQTNYFITSKNIFFSKVVRLKYFHQVLQIFKSNGYKVQGETLLRDDFARD